MGPIVEGGNYYFEIIKSILDLGPIGVVLILGYFAKQQLEKSSTQYRDQINAILAQYRDDMMEQRRMYENNVELVKAYQVHAGDLKDVIIMNTQAMTKLVDRIEKEAR
ncbi:MAG: hypothetical protein KKC20_01060 [Proteobacteria bacterium]|nr:hypothetical protein [Pseudomonadota bacterium]